MRRLFFGMVALLGTAEPSVGQLPEGTRSPLSAATAVVPDTVTVGDRFRSVLRITTSPEASVASASLSAGAYLQLTDSVRVVQGSSADEWLIYFPMVAWRTGVQSPVRATVAVASPDGRTRRYETVLALPFVASVLSADTSGLQPRGHKGIVPAPAGSYPVWLPFVAVAILLAAAFIVWRFLVRDQRGGAFLERSPRERALAALQSPELRSLIDDGDPTRAGSYLSEVMRKFLAESEPRGGLHLTTTEVVRAMASAGVAAPLLRGAGDILGELDRVKFSDAPAARDEVVQLLEELRGLIVEWS